MICRQKATAITAVEKHLLVRAFSSEALAEIGICNGGYKSCKETHSKVFNCQEALSYAVTMDCNRRSAKFSITKISKKLPKYSFITLYL